MTQTYSSPKPTVIITQEALHELTSYVAAVKTEISGLGRVENRNNQFIITKILLFPQVCTPGDTVLSQAAIADYMYNALENGETTADLRVWWHSHADMEVFWSGTDEDTIARFNNQWMISVVANRRGEVLARLDSYRPLSITVNDLPVYWRKQKNAVLRSAESIDEEVRSKVIITHMKRKVKRGPDKTT